MLILEAYLKIALKKRSTSTFTFLHPSLYGLSCWGKPIDKILINIKMPILAKNGVVGISHSWNIGILVLKMPILTALGGVWETSKHSLMISNHQISMFCFGKGCGNFFKMATRP